MRSDRGYLDWSAAALAAALIGIAVLLAPSPTTAQGTPEQRAACEPDAMRLCQEFAPDADRITACMARKRAQLSPQCAVYFRPKHRPKRH